MIKITDNNYIIIDIFDHETYFDYMCRLLPNTSHGFIIRMINNSFTQEVRREHKQGTSYSRQITISGVDYTNHILDTYPEYFI